MSDTTDRQRKSVDGDVLVDAIGNLMRIADDSEAFEPELYEDAKELGLNRHQLAIARKYDGEGRITVDSARTPNLAEKLAAGAELPWTFVLDSVEFIVKAPSGAKRSSTLSTWLWHEEGYRFRYYKHDGRDNEILIEAMEE